MIAAIKRGLLGAVVLTLVVLLLAYARPKPHKHSITVKFDYDFRLTPACSSDTTKGTDAKKECIQEFVVYDISVGSSRRTKLATIPVPAGAKGLVKGISGKTPLLLFAPGKHIIAVVARTPDGKESDPGRCTTTVKVSK